EEPMLDVRYFKNPGFSTGTGGMILLFLSMFGVMFLLTQYFQLIIGYSALETAVRFLPMSPVMMIVGMQSPRITAAIGANKAVALGMIFNAISMFMLIGLHTTPNYPYVLTAFIFLAGGLALSMSPMTAAIMIAVPPRRAGAGSATNDATREIGAALGVAVLGSVAASQFSSKIGPLVSGLPASLQGESRSSLSGALRSAGEIGGPTGETLAEGARHAFIAGIHEAALVGGVLLALAAVCIWKFFPTSVSHSGAEQGHHGGAPGAANPSGTLDDAELTSVLEDR
ncbi:MAG: MFS transporter, partial [Acidimicrobiia bacterium]